MSNKKIAIIGASYLQLPLIAKAKELGYETHVFAWKREDVGEKEADYFYPISITEKEKILNICKQIRINGVCSIASDMAVITVNYVAEKLGLIGNSIHSSQICTNKFLMRKQFWHNNDPVPKFLLYTDEENIEGIEYPVIVKPVDRSGSRGVTKVNNVVELKHAICIAKKESFCNQALIEEYVEGREYSAEYLSYRGKHYFIAITTKYTTGFPNFIETGHSEPSDLDADKIKNIQRIIEHALDTLEIQNGASHSEFKIDKDGRVKIIEIGSRMGGDCIGSDLVPLTTGIDYVRAVIQIACGDIPNMTPCEHRCKAKVVYILTREDLEQFYKIKNESSDRILKVFDFHPEKIGNVTDSSNRAGGYIVRL